MDMTPKAYQEYVKARAPKSPIVRDCLRAFLVGGLICTLGQAIQNGWLAAGLTKDACRLLPGPALCRSHGTEPL